MSRLFFVSVASSFLQLSVILRVPNYFQKDYSRSHSYQLWTEMSFPLKLYKHWVFSFFLVFTSLTNEYQYLTIAWICISLTAEVVLKLDLLELCVPIIYPFSIGIQFVETLCLLKILTFVIDIIYFFLLYLLSFDFLIVTFLS